MKKKTILLFILVAMVSLNFSNYQKDLTESIKKKVAKYNKTRATEKLYIHLDKNILIPGNKIWFKAYCLKSDKHYQKEKSEILTISIVSKSKEEKIKKNYRIKDGKASGNFQIPQSIKPGKYYFIGITEEMAGKNDPCIFKTPLEIKSHYPAIQIKAVLKDTIYKPGQLATARIYVENNDHQPLDSIPFNYIIFHGEKKLYSDKMITNDKGYRKLKFQIPENMKDEAPLILEAKSNYKGHECKTTAVIPSSNNKIHLSFFPESGNLINGIQQKVAFMARDQFGEPLDIEGYLYKNEKKIKKINSFFNGRGTFTLKPEKEAKYFVKIIQPIKQNSFYSLPELKSKGYQIHITKNTKNYIEFNVKTNQENLNQEITMIAIMDGKIFWHEKLKSLQDNQIKIDSKKFPMGILKLTLLNKDLIPMAERLIFINKHKKLDINIKSEQKNYQTKSKVTLDINVRDYKGNPIPANLSLAVTDGRCLNGNYKDLISYHYLTSELKGKINNPEQYLIDHPKADTAMDLLMLTNGWRRYNWKEIKNSGRSVESNSNYLKCSVKKKDKAVRKTTIDLFRPKFVIKPQIMYNAIEAQNSKVQMNNPHFFGLLRKETDKEGNFYLKENEFLSILDTGNIYLRIHSRPRNDYQVETTIPFLNTYIDTNNLIENKNGNLRLMPSYPLVSKNETNDFTINYSQFDEKNVLMESIRVTAKRRTKVSEIERVSNYVVKEVKKEQLQNMSPTRSFLSILATVTSGYTILNNQILLRGYNSLINNSGALIVVDGIPVGSNYNQVNYLDPSDIENIKVTKSMGAAKKYQGSHLGGLIEIETVGYEKSTVRKSKSSRFLVMKGYEISKKFYSPVYSTKEEKLNTVDTRRTLYWNPNISIDETGQKTISFYNSDTKMNTYCIIQGMNNKYEGSGSYSYKVY